MIRARMEAEEKELEAKTLRAAQAHKRKQAPAKEATQVP